MLALFLVLLIAGLVVGIVMTREKQETSQPPYSFELLFGELASNCGGQANPAYSFSDMIQEGVQLFGNEFGTKVLADSQEGYWYSYGGTRFTITDGQGTVNAPVACDPAPP